LFISRSFKKGRISDTKIVVEVHLPVADGTPIDGVLDFVVTLFWVVDVLVFYGNVEVFLYVCVGRDWDDYGSVDGHGGLLFEKEIGASGWCNIISLILTK
jgi:hypothetical protein